MVVALEKNYKFVFGKNNAVFILLEVISVLFSNDYM